MGLTNLLFGGLKHYAAKAAEDSESKQQQRANLFQQGAKADNFAEFGQNSYGAMTNESTAARDRLRQLAEGKDSLSAEQLRQGLQQNYAAQRSMAAGAAPQDAGMAARTAAMQMGRMGAGMSGQAAMAGIAERQAAQKALMDSILQQRQQDAQVALGSRQNSISGYGGITPEQSLLDKWANPAAAGLGVITKSDRRAKEDIQGGDAKAKKITDGLRAFSYKYKDSRDGSGEQFGIMAQDLESKGLGHAVIDTPKGKYVDGAKAATASLGLVAALGKRVSDLEKRKK
jgi:Chaperone of endosialidase